MGVARIPGQFKAGERAELHHGASAPPIYLGMRVQGVCTLKRGSSSAGACLHRQA
jgi:hypothetical protein